MLLANTWTPLLYIFYILGQSAFPSTKLASQSYSKQFFLKSPALIVFSVSLYVTIHFFYQDFSFAWKNQGLDVIHVLLILSSLITNIIITYRCLFRGSVCIELQESFSALEVEFQKLLPNGDVQLAKFRNAFLMKCFALLLSYFIVVFAMTMSRIQTEYSHTSLMIVLAFINDLCALQIVLYVDLTKFFLKTISHTFRNIDGDEARGVREAFIKNELLISTKKCYTSIARTVDTVNRSFGLFLLTYMIQQFLAISYYIYWVLLNKFNIGLWSSLGVQNFKLILVCEVFILNL